MDNLTYSDFIEKQRTKDKSAFNSNDWSKYKTRASYETRDLDPYSYGTGETEISKNILENMINKQEKPVTVSSVSKPLLDNLMAKNANNMGLISRGKGGSQDDIVDSLSNYMSNTQNLVGKDLSSQVSDDLASRGALMGEFGKSQKSKSDNWNKYMEHLMNLYTAGNIK